jgi:hypothetical protein
VAIDWTKDLLRLEGKRKGLIVNPLEVPGFINRSESFIGIYSDADTSGETATPLGCTLHEGNAEVKTETNKMN